MAVKQFAREAVAVIVGFVSAAFSSISFTALLKTFWPVARDLSPPTWYHGFDLMYSLLGMAIGGFIAAWISRNAYGVRLFAGTMFLLGIVTAAGGFDPVHPVWYQWAAGFLAPVAVLAGASVRWRRLKP